MAIGESKLHRLLRNGSLLYDSVAWVEVIDTSVKQRILYWIQQKQLYEEGIDENDAIIGTYSSFTESLHPDKKAGTHYTLLLTGAFYDSMHIKVEPTAIDIYANGQKDDDNLFEKYGKGIIGLTTENKDKLSDELLPKYQKYLKRVLFRTG